jgi:hypothetical protein
LNVPELHGLDRSDITAGAGTNNAIQIIQMQMYQRDTTSM